jgi:hypothetical protein
MVFVDFLRDSSQDQTLRSNYSAARSGSHCQPTSPYSPSSCNFQRRSVLLAMRASSATARELFAERAVDGQAEDIAWLAEIRA